MYTAIHLVTALTKAQTNTQWSSHRICIVFTFLTATLFPSSLLGVRGRPTQAVHELRPFWV
jgi:hypothetical protein